MVDQLDGPPKIPVTLRKLYNMEPENSPIEDHFPLETSGFGVPC